MSAAGLEGLRRLTASPTASACSRCLVSLPAQPVPDSKTPMECCGRRCAAGPTDCTAARRRCEMGQAWQGAARRWRA